MLNCGVLNKSLNEFVEQDCELLKQRDLQSVDALLKTKKGDKGDSSRIFDKLKKTFNSHPDLKEEYEEKITTDRILLDTREEVNFLIDFLVGKYKSELTGYISSSGSKSLKCLQDALKKANKSPQPMTDRLGVFKKLLPCMVDRSLLDSLKLLSKNGIACFNATCINVVLRELLVRYVQFKTEPSSLAFTEDEKEFYEKMINLENSTGSWLQNAIYQVNTNPQNSKPIKLDTDDAHVPEDEPSRLHQYSFILRVLQALGCSAQQVNIRVGMVFEGEILYLQERMYTQTTENARGPLSNNRWKIYEFLHSNEKASENISKKADSDCDKNEDFFVDRHNGYNKSSVVSVDRDFLYGIDNDHLRRSLEKSVINHARESDIDGFHQIPPTSRDDDDAEFYNNILSMLTETDASSINPLDEVLQLNQVEPKDLIGKKRLFDELRNDDDLDEILEDLMDPGNGLEFL